MTEFPKVRPDDELAAGENVGVPASVTNQQQGIQGRIAYILNVGPDGKLTIQLGSEKKVVDRSQLDGGRRFNAPPEQDRTPPPNAVDGDNR